MTYPKCKKLDVLRHDRSGHPIVSTGSLYCAIGNTLYQRATMVFEYDGQYPSAGPVEKWLKLNWKRISRKVRND